MTVSLLLTFFGFGMSLWIGVKENHFSLYSVILTGVMLSLAHCFSFFFVLLAEKIPYFKKYVFTGFRRAWLFFFLGEGVFFLLFQGVIKNCIWSVPLTIPLVCSSCAGIILFGWIQDRLHQQKYFFILKKKQFFNLFHTKN